jgi:hypothetical protein
MSTMSVTPHSGAEGHICLALAKRVDLRLIFAYAVEMTVSANNASRHLVYMYFQQRYGWHCQFLEADLKTSLPCKLHFTDDDKIRQIVRRGNGISTAESHHTLEYAIRNGRGGVFLHLNEEQYQRLK